MGALIGVLLGVHGLLLFVFIGRPATWLFVSFDFGRALLLFGYSSMIFIGLCAITGYLIEKKFFSHTKERKHHGTSIHHKQ